MTNNDKKFSTIANNYPSYQDINPIALNAERYGIQFFFSSSFTLRSEYINKLKA